MAGEVDLHIHSNKSSDGDHSPAELINLAKSHGFKAIAIADHDTVAAYPEAMNLAAEAGVELIPSVELTTLLNGREFHLLLPFMNWESAGLLNLIARVHQARFEEAKERVAKLQSLGFDIEWADVNRGEASPPLGVVIAQALLRKNSSRRDPRLAKYFESFSLGRAPYIFYEDYFREGRPAYVPKKIASILDVLPQAAEFGAAPVLAHPGADFELASYDDLCRLKERGLVGLEVFSTYHDEEQTAFYWQLAKQLDLVPTAGSDFHGKIKPHVSFGLIQDGAYWMVEALRERTRRVKKCP